MMNYAHIFSSGVSKVETDPILGETIVTPISVERDNVIFQGRRLTRLGLTFLDFSHLDPFAFYPDAMYGNSFMAEVIFEQLRALMAQITQPLESGSSDSYTRHKDYPHPKGVLKWD